jgi:hypothetical protein
MDNKEHTMEWEHYERCWDFFGMFEAGDFDEETDDGVRWQGFRRNDDGKMELCGEFVYDRDANGAQLNSGKGWGL